MVLYEPGKTDHGLPHDPFKACVIPRPIGWISTISSTGAHNLAPYSQFNNLTFDPPYVMFSANQTPSAKRKDTVTNAETTGRFVWNLATYPLREAVNISAEQVPPGVDEFARAGLQKEDSIVLDGPRVPMVADSPVKFECVYHSTLRLPANPPMATAHVVIGRVVAVHIKDEFLTDGILDVRKTLPIARCGYYQYTVVRDTFDMVIPSTEGLSEDLLAGLEGSSKGNRELEERKRREEEEERNRGERANKL
ncbi:nitrilotriacetate monooxygenase component B-like protein [Phyllosticta citriasiana]|uniref:Nitrilotriacetate monooxygenase component B-like protein n=1 Tax=Phyllosticta citriasiana TaxID=595635 RepID=A0ABR1L1P3_9PEZI